MTVCRALPEGPSPGAMSPIACYASWGSLLWSPYGPDEDPRGGSGMCRPAGERALRLWDHLIDGPLVAGLLPSIRSVILAEAQRVGASYVTISDRLQEIAIVRGPKGRSRVRLTHLPPYAIVEERT